LAAREATETCCAAALAATAFIMKCACPT